MMPMRLWSNVFFSKETCYLCDGSVADVSQKNHFSDTLIPHLKNFSTADKRFLKVKSLKCTRIICGETHHIWER